MSEYQLSHQEVSFKFIHSGWLYLEINSRSQGRKSASIKGA